MIASGFVQAPKAVPFIGTPPIPPASTVILSPGRPSSLATLAIPSGIPIPKLITAAGSNSIAARRHTTLRAFNGIGSIESTGTRISPQNDGLYGSEYVCQ